LNVTDAVHLLKQFRAQFKALQDILDDLEAELLTSSRVLFCSPATGKIEGATNIFGGDWFDATGYGKAYNSAGAMAYHTGCDLNRPNYADAGAPVYAAAEGKIVFNGQVPSWQGDVLVIEHTLEAGGLLWTRYAHIKALLPYRYQVQRGDQIGVIADYNADGPKGDHLHFDVTWLDLGTRPGDWPGQNKERLVKDYVDPAAWLCGRAR
jgi:murein DD-endopeptidase MepM/ murein hydrolase activator NlpD